MTFTKKFYHLSFHFYLGMPNGCPHCHCANNWSTCSNCGGTCCNSCGKDSNGKKRRAVNVCTYCGKNVQMKVGSKPPSWAKW